MDEKSGHSDRRSIEEQPPSRFERWPGGDEEASLDYRKSAVIKHEALQVGRRLGDGFSHSGLGNGTNRSITSTVVHLRKPRKSRSPVRTKGGSILFKSTEEAVLINLLLVTSKREWGVSGERESQGIVGIDRMHANDLSPYRLQRSPQ